MVFRDHVGVSWLAEGWHRYEALRQLKRKGTMVIVHQGGIREAVLHAAGANAGHGLRRTDSDKRNAVRTLLVDPEWRTMADRDVARRCAVSHKLVASVRRELESQARGAIDFNERLRLQHAPPAGEPVIAITSRPDRREPEPIHVPTSPFRDAFAVPEEAQAKVVEIRARGGVPRVYQNKHGNVGVMDVSKIGLSETLDLLKDALEAGIVAKRLLTAAGVGRDHAADRDAAAHVQPRRPHAADRSDGKRPDSLSHDAVEQIRFFEWRHVSGVLEPHQLLVRRGNDIEVRGGDRRNHLHVEPSQQEEDRHLKAAEIAL